MGSPRGRGVGGYHGAPRRLVHPDRQVRPATVVGHTCEPGGLLFRVGSVAMTASDRDEQLLRALYDRYAASLWWFVLRLTGGDRARSQDVVQETMLRAWRKPSVLDEQ